MACAPRREPLAPKPSGRLAGGGSVRIAVPSPPARAPLLAALEGPFRPSGERVLVAAAEAPGGGRVERIELVTAGDPGEALARGEVDLALLWGAEAARVAAAVAAGGELALDRAGGWDRAYALWFDSSQRWVNDPRFRRWLARAIDRAALVAPLFGGHARPIERLTALEDAPPPLDGVPRRPLEASSRPRLTLRYEADDPIAARLATRLRAELAASAVEVVPLPSATLVAEPPAHLTLVSQPARPAEPLATLDSTLAPFGAQASAARRILARSAGVTDAERRRTALRHAEDGLLIEGRLAPLVRVEAWVGRDAGLRGVETGGWGELDLSGAGFWH